MDIIQLPQDWTPQAHLEIVGRINVGIESLARVRQFSVTLNEHEFPAFRYVDLLAGDTPVALVEYEGVPGWTYVRMESTISEPAKFVASLLADLGIAGDSAFEQEGEEATEA